MATTPRAASCFRKEVATARFVGPVVAVLASVADVGEIDAEAVVAAPLGLAGQRIVLTRCARK